ncbi:hypothetical protein [Streptomyces roseicoloratus]|uniref:Uncharacterized protein n=1 Tax=Streptomyces roseicoloratus TaxID=2508722 RepID=A0ABY9RZQ7_9ACTN|nr:hypothetical protein [Streptomyces roseicoloratus]WMX46664.1 hypothetical protein RGF97_20055 [Streptomyces roseicoloratus]
MSTDTDLTDAQKQALKENADDLEQFRQQLDEVRDRARSRLERVGLVTGPDAPNCLVCTICEGWKQGAAGSTCANCAHGFHAHNVK